MNYYYPSEESYENRIEIGQVNGNNRQYHIKFEGNLNFTEE